MFGNPRKKLQKQYEAKLKQAMEAQRSGDIQNLSILNQEAEKLLEQINELEKQST